LADKIIAYIDGGSRGNPGPAAAGFVLTDNSSNRLEAKGFLIGETTNNVAEYSAFLKALEAAKQLDAKHLAVFSDSQLLVRQINGQYKVKSENIIGLYQKATKLLLNFESWQVNHVTRDKNVLADKLVNMALDENQDVQLKSKVTKPKGPAIRLAVLISGGGTTLLNILEHIKDGRLNAKVSLVISSLSKAAGVERAKNAHLPVKIIRKKDYPDIKQFSKAIETELVSANIDLVIQGGWLCLWHIPQRYKDRVMNIHPALLPSFGGKGMWGHHVHEAVLKSGCKISGCTVHFCTNEYDKGAIIVQRTCPVKEEDDPDSLAQRVFEQECIAYPEAIKLFMQSRLKVQGTKVSIKNS
jgi:formyltetrahydrofolate-dependent phosphoribosylglycinamide formyltransferase